MDHLSLPPDLERFAAKAVADGRYRDTADVIEAGLGLPQRAEGDRKALIASLEQAQAEGRRDGFYAAEEIDRQLEEIILAAERRQA